MSPADTTPGQLPSYAELPVTSDAPAGSSWGLWPNQQIGTLNLLTPATVVEARDSIVTGEIFPLDLDFAAIDPPLFGRDRAHHEVIRYPNTAQDDRIDNWNTQSSSQWDGFRHQRHPEHEYYGGIPDPEHGIGAWAAHGIATRAVVLDIPRARAARGDQVLQLDTRSVITTEELRQCLDHEGTTPRPGDLLLIRTGWLEWYLNLPAASRSDIAVSGAYTGPGLEPTAAMAELLWDLHVCAVAADNPTLEAWPRQNDEFLHHHLLNMLGIPIGELWNLAPLAQACAQDGRWDCFVTSAPLNVAGGVGSPANAVAIR
jgi:kynurenine formamidase